MEVRVADRGYHQQQSRPEFAKQTVMLMESADAEDRQHQQRYTEWIANDREAVSEGFDLQLGLRAETSVRTSDATCHGH
jgi:hypothetical protein